MKKISPLEAWNEVPNNEIDKPTLYHVKEVDKYFMHEEYENELIGIILWLGVLLSIMLTVLILVVLTWLKFK